jgi:flavin-binding protein dodecin
MGDAVFKKIEVTGCSDKNVEDAIQNAITRASKTVRQMRWFEVVEIRGAISNAEVHEWQVTVKIGFKLEE